MLGSPGSPGCRPPACSATLPLPTTGLSGYLLPHDACLPFEPEVGFLFIPKLFLILGFDILDFSVFIFFNLFLGLFKLPQLLPDIFLCLAQKEAGVGGRLRTRAQGPVIPQR